MARKHKNITRFDYGNTHGWWLRIYRKPMTCGKTVIVCSKLFSDRKCGGSDVALREALQTRDSYRAINGMFPVQDPPPRFREYPTVRNKTGVNGVCLTYSSRGKYKYPCYSVFWIDVEGKYHNTRFFLKHYILRRAAFYAAVKFRKEKENDLLGRYPDEYVRVRS